jgi:hypothetical protein
MIFPSIELGRKIASEDSRTQCQILEGFASKQLLDTTYNNQTIISLVALLSSETVLWFIEIYQEIVKQSKLPKQAVKYNEDLIEEALTEIRKRKKTD